MVRDFKKVIASFLVQSLTVFSIISTWKLNQLVWVSKKDSIWVFAGNQVKIHRWRCMYTVCTPHSLHFLSSKQFIKYSSKRFSWQKCDYLSHDLCHVISRDRVLLLNMAAKKIVVETRQEAVDLNMMVNSLQSRRSTGLTQRFRVFLLDQLGVLPWQFPVLSHPQGCVCLEI